MSLLGVVKFVLGVLLAIAILFGAGVGVTRYMLTRLATPPPRPTFANDPSPSPVKAEAAVAASSPSPSAQAAAAQPSPSPTDSPSPSPSPDGYQARVTQPIGLIVRQDPNPDSTQLGGVEYNQNVTVLEDNSDGSWQKVRLANGTEGWVKGGNVERAN
jgi:hypothetical protein